MKSKKDLLHYDSGDFVSGEKIGAFLLSDHSHFKLKAEATNNSAWDFTSRSTRGNSIIKVGSEQSTNTYIFLVLDLVFLEKM